MAIKRKKGGAQRRQNRQQADGSLPLMNEKLVKAIMDQSYASSPDTVQLRLVVEKGNGEPTTSEETSLANAITISLDHGLDLVEISLGHDLPVVRAVNYEAKQYRVNKQKALKQKENKDLDLKEFRFRAKTAAHDFERKIGRVMEALEKGHRCKVACTCPTRLILNQQEPMGAQAVIDRIVLELEEVGDTTRPPDVNKEKTYASVMLVPRKDTGKNKS